MFANPHALPDPDRDAQFYEGVQQRRVFAFLIDLVVILLIDVAIWIVLGLVGIVTFGLGWLLIVPAVLASGFLYRWYMLANHSGTIGMMLTGIEIRRADGQRLDPATALAHTALFTVSLISVILMLISFAVALVTPRGQMLHDLLLGTVAINRPL